MNAERQPPEIFARIAGVADHARLTDIMATSFLCDPTWGPLFGEGDDRRRAALLPLAARHARRQPRARGIGMGLLAGNLRRVDALGMPAYLESTNPVNDARYARHGFEPLVSFTVATGAVVTTMWREPR